MVARSVLMRFTQKVATGLESVAAFQARSWQLHMLRDSPVQLLKMPRCFWYLSHFKPTMIWTLLATPPWAPSGAHVPFIIFIATAMKSAFILFNFVRMSLSLALGLSQCCCRREEGQTHAPLQSLQLQPITNHFNPFHQWHEMKSQNTCPAVDWR